MSGLEGAAHDAVRDGDPVRVPFWEEMGATPVFFVRVASKGLIRQVLVRVAGNRLKIARFVIAA